MPPETVCHPTFAAIDIGSHTVRLLIARLENSSFLRPVLVERAVTRLARNFNSDGRLKHQNITATIKVIGDYVREAESHRVHALACGATGVIRKAKNSKQFVEMIRRQTGLRVSVLSEQSEARLSAKGILSTLADPQGLILCFDLGGSSTEFVLLDPEATLPLWTISLFLGAATITEKHLRRDPPSQKSINQAIEEIRNIIKPALQHASILRDQEKVPPGRLQLIGTAGTVTTLAAMKIEMTEYQPYLINSLELTGGWLDELIGRLGKMTLAERKNLPGLEEGREDIILGGAVIVREILRELNRDQLTATDAGLLEGLLLNLVEKECGLPHTLKTPFKWHW